MSSARTPVGSARSTRRRCSGLGAAASSGTWTTSASGPAPSRGRPRGSTTRPSRPGPAGTRGGVAGRDDLVAGRDPRRGAERHAGRAGAGAAAVHGDDLRRQRARRRVDGDEVSRRRRGCRARGRRGRRRRSPSRGSGAAPRPPPRRAAPAPRRPATCVLESSSQPPNDDDSGTQVPGEGGSRAQHLLGGRDGRGHVEAQPAHVALDVDRPGPHGGVGHELGAAG